MKSPTPLLRLLLITAAASAAAAAGDGCNSGCNLAVAAYYTEANQNLTYVAGLFGIADYRTLKPYNLANMDSIPVSKHVTVNFPCRCLALPVAPFSTYLAGSFPYKTSTADTYTSIAARFSNLTTAAWLQATNNYPANNNILDAAVVVNVTINCSCGDPRVSPNLRLFLTYPLRDGETLYSVAENNGFLLQCEMDLLRRYNPGMDGATGKGIVFIPLRGGPESPTALQCTSDLLTSSTELSSMETLQDGHNSEL